ncbi:probable DNA double-strand break repair Rad50 ATPase [Diorhabda carinulata]|uniref:probable DNA double-strand break repair Rad50 ATPase n=1 Tax=Diorhabda carinulata TaxID=1163345 RepID=UPI0025A2794D|nr:probable DNA double-strand break repair Rad50 ATPase [Diorhabda carinulata]
MDIISKENGSSTFLSILYDKNSTISKLRQQLENQKLQILYYMKRELNYRKMIELSRTCRTENTEDLPVVLDFAQFTKQNGMKSIILRLYEHMKHIDRKLYKYLNTQEFILRKISEKLYEVLEKPYEQRILLQQTINPAVYLDLFIALLEATVGLRQKLNSFRICCNRLILIEDERNHIVEQVLSLPPQERINCNILICMKQEILELKYRMRECKEHEVKQQKDLRKLNNLKHDLNNLKNGMTSSIEGMGDLSIVENMVVGLKFETKKILEANRRHQKKQKLRQIQIIANLIKLAASGGNLQTNDEDELLMFDVIKKEVHSLQTKFSTELQIIKTEHECTKCKLKTVLQERNELKVIEHKLQDRLKKIQKKYDTEVISLKKERNEYKSQVEELTIFQEAYHQGNNTLKHLEKELCSMKELINQDFLDSLNDKKQKLSKEMDELQESKSSKEKSDQKIVRQLPSSSSSSKVMEIIKKIKQNILNDNKFNKKRDLSCFSFESKLKKDKNKVESCSRSEFKLLCDCSHETIPIYCKSTHTTKDSATSGPSKNLEVLALNKILHSSSDDSSFPDA